jgi:hypothetical protein
VPLIAPGETAAIAHRWRTCSGIEVFVVTVTFSKNNRSIHPKYRVNRGAPKICGGHRSVRLALDPIPSQGSQIELLSCWWPPARLRIAMKGGRRYDAGHMCPKWKQGERGGGKQGHKEAEK